MFLKILEMLFLCARAALVTENGLSVNDHNGTLLYTDVFKNYHPNVRPVIDAGHPVIVDLYMDLVKILAVDEMYQTFKTTANIELTWFDERLVWNATDYGNIYNLVLPLDKNLWLPDLMNYNAAYHPGELGQKYAFPSVSNNGFVCIWLRVNLETQCEIRTKKYPFDEQECNIQFTTFTSTDNEVRLKTTQNSTEPTFYVETAEWVIPRNYVTTEVMIEEGFPHRIITYNFLLQRTCTSCIVNTLLPVLILTMLNLLSFFVPTESGEKLAFPMSVFLTLAVFLTIIMVSLPESVDGVSYICMFVTFELGVSAATLLFTVITLRLHHEMGDTQIPPYAKLMVKMFRRSCVTNDSGKLYNAGNNSTDSRQEIITDKTGMDENSSTSIEELNVGHVGKVNAQSANIKWDHVSDAFDMMMFLILVVIQLIAITTFLILITI